MTDDYKQKYEDAKAFKNKLAEIDQLKDRIEKLEAALQEFIDPCIEHCFDTCQSECDPMKDCPCFKARKALEGTPDMSVYKEGYRAVEEAMGHPSPEFWVERK